MRLEILVTVLALLLGALSVTDASGQSRRRSERSIGGVSIAAKPPMGWNSWDCYGPSVTEIEVKANADYMSKYMKAYGWEYIVVDIQWYEPLAKAHGYRPNAELVMDSYGRLLPALNRFPSAAGGKGFKPLADYIHSLGLKFGLHIVRGIPRQAVRANTPVLGTKLHAQDVAKTESICPWIDDMYGVKADTAGGQAYYDSIVRQFAEWGVDYIKADDMSAFTHDENRGADEARLSEIAALGRAIKKSNRPIILSLSPGPAAVTQVEVMRESAQLWRISGDFWDRWEDLRRQFDLTRKWIDHTGPGRWADADMLPLGRIAIRGERGNDRRSLLTQDEQFTLVTLWAIFRSPLMMGGDLPSNDDFTLKLLTNPEVIAVNQNSTNNREFFARGSEISWIADVPGTQDKYFAVFEVGDDTTPAKIKVRCKELVAAQRCKVRDLWARRELGVFEEIISTVNRHGARLYRVSPVSAKTKASSN
jgi:alpha-galactosidase